VFLEDVMKTFGTAAKLRLLLITFLLPAWAINRLFLERADGDALATAS